MESELSSMKSTLIKVNESPVVTLDDIRTDKKTETKTANVTKHYKWLESEIKFESQKVKDLIDLKEKKLLDDLNVNTSTELGKLKGSIQTGERVILMYEQQIELIDQAMKSDCEMDIYEMYQSCAFGETELADDTNTDTKNKRTVDRITLRGNTDKLIETLSGLQLGEIDVVYEREVDLGSALVLQRTIGVKVTDELGACPIDVIVLDVNGTDTLVVVDCLKGCVKSFYRRNNQPCHSKLSLDDDPCSLTQLKRNQVAVTLPETKQILTLEVSPDLKLLSRIKTSNRYRGITAITPSLIAASPYSPHSVDILDMTGTVIRSLTPKINNKAIIQYPQFLCTTVKNNILVSDNLLGSVLCLTPEGDVVFRYCPGAAELMKPRGITVTNTGDILVADSDQHRVLHLTESGQFVRNILTSQEGMYIPYGLCVDNRGRLYVCLRCDGVIKVFSN